MELGNLLRAQARLAEAGQCHRKPLQNREGTLGARHLSAATGYDRLGCGVAPASRGRTAIPDRPTEATRLESVPAADTVRH